jgi:hypothetical protein
MISLLWEVCDFAVHYKIYKVYYVRYRKSATCGIFLIEW